MPQRLLFSKTTVAAIKPPRAGRETYYDSKVPKLAVRVTAAGSKTFYVVTRVGPLMRWYKLGVFGADMTVEQARKAATSTLGEFAEGQDPSAERRAEREQMTFGEAFEEYMERHIAAKGRKTGDDLRALWERCLGDLPDAPKKKHAPVSRSKHPHGVNWQRRPINAITRGDVAKLHSALGKTTKTTANRVVELGSAIFGKLKDWSLWKGDNPFEDIEDFEEVKRDRFLRQEELPRFFSALAQDTKQDFKDFVALALLTGARRGNVLSMRWGDIDDARAVWRIPAPSTKGNETIDVVLVPEAVAILKRRSDNGSEYVFAAKSQTGYMEPPKKRWRALLDRAKIDNVRIHDLRRSLGSWQAILGASLPIVGQSLGHKSASATQVYARLHIDPVRASVERATSAMLVAGGLKQTAVIKKHARSKKRARA